MSGDVQPRKRKDKKKKKDELGVEEPRGTAAVLGEGDVFMHSYHEHGTGGHWCAKIIFFSLLAVLLTLIGLIILENRGLSELEANAVESRYSGVLEGWLEDAPDDDHHDVHTLELKHHDDDDHEETVDDHDDEIDHDDEDHGGDDENDSEQDHDDEGHEDEDDEDQNEDDENEQDDDDDQELEPADDEDEDGGHSYNEYFRTGDDDEDQDEENEDDKYTEEDDDEDKTLVDENDDESDEKNDDDENEVDRNDFDEEQEAYESRENEDEDEHEEDEDEEDDDTEVEHIEKEVSEEEPISLDLPTLPEDEDDDDDDKHDDKEENEEDSVEDDDEEFLEADDEPPVVERITAPAGKPFVEVEEEDSSELPPDTLEEEEEYEKQQEELRREEEQASHMWLKLAVGGALLVATHAVVRRATAGASRDEPEQEERDTREETPLNDRRMTLIPEEPSRPVAPKKVFQEPIFEEVTKKMAPIVKSAPLPKQESEEEDQEPEESEEEIEEINKDDEEKELYSDEELEEEEEVIVKKDIPKKSVPVLEVKKETPKKYVPVAEAKKETPKPVPVKEKTPEPDDDVPDDVEIIDEEQLDEELEEEDEEEEISDVDDVELLTRLEAKYGRLPEPERPGQKHKDGGNSIRDEWPGEPSDAYWRQELDSAEREIRQGSWSAAARRAGAAALGGSARARWLAALALDREAEAKRDNALLSRAIAAYIHLLKMNEQLSDEKLLEITSRALDRIKFRGNYLSAEPIYRLLIRRFPNDPAYRNNLTISFLMANRADLAEESLKETLRLRPNDRVALAHYGFVLKTEHNKLEEAVEAFQKALEGDEGPACEPRFYYHLGDALLLLGRYKEAHEVHKRGAKLGHFLSPAQRSLYNIERLKSQPWWNVEKTPYAKLASSLEKSWRDILREGEAARTLYEKEKEGLKDRGEWSQLDLFLRGREVPDRCKRAPVTCSIVKAEAAAVGCRRGQIKFSAMEPGTHVRPHVGPTNCRLRMHLGLSNTKDTYIRVDQEIRQWQEGKVLMFDDSFEHEVWHNGTGKRLVLIVDVWHPDITPAERRQLPAI